MSYRVELANIAMWYEFMTSGKGLVPARSCGNLEDPGLALRSSPPSLAILLARYGASSRSSTANDGDQPMLNDPRPLLHHKVCRHYTVLAVASLRLILLLFLFLRMWNVLSRLERRLQPVWRSFTRRASLASMRWRAGQSLSVGGRQRRYWSFSIASAFRLWSRGMT